jgi:branched-chain amino acid transport system substrate-binding protein
MIHRCIGRLRLVVPLVLTAAVLISGCRTLQDLLPKLLPGIIKVGLVAPFEGSYRYVGYDAVYAARLAVREINAAGGIDGWQLELVAYDDRGDAALAAQIAGNLIIDPDVVAVIGHYRAETSASAGTVYAEAGLPNLVIGDSASPSATAWYLAPPPAKVAEAMGTVGLSSNPETAGVWIDAQVPEAPAEHLRAYLIDHALILVAGDEAEMVFSLLGPVDAASRLADMRAAGWMGLIVGTEDLASAAFLAVGGDAVVGAQFVTPYPMPQDLPDTQSWIEAYCAMGPHVANPGPYALPTYEAVYLVAEALSSVLETTTSPSRRALGQALGDVARRGRLGEIRWDARRYWELMPLYHYRWTEESVQLVQILP